MSAGAVIAVRVTPRSSREAVEGPDPGGVLHVRVTAAPAAGAANRAVIKLVSKTLDVPKSSVTIVSGASSRMKRLSIDGLEAGALAALLPGAMRGRGAPR